MDRTGKNQTNKQINFKKLTSKKCKRIFSPSYHFILDFDLENIENTEYNREKKIAHKMSNNIVCLGSLGKRI